MRDEAKAREALFAVQNSKVAQPLKDFYKHVATICRPLLNYRTKLPFDTKSGFQGFSRRYLNPSSKNAQADQQGIEGSFTEA